jgi:hypothetical protein
VSCRLSRRPHVVRKGIPPKCTVKLPVPLGRKPSIPGLDERAGFRDIVVRALALLPDKVNETRVEGQ